MRIRRFCRRFKLNDTIFKAYADSYDDPILTESDEFEDWYWLDAVPFIEEFDDSHDG